ncbi:MAG TPA: lipoate--protein ligase family protein [Acidimicrobiia bacterium]|nr:lipoate--protein ligase family protein [Acidimicrobiia bacterium]
MDMLSTLRIIDFGEVSALRSQTLWHAVAHGVSAGSPPTLSFMEPTEPYVSIGFHRSSKELDPTVCGPGGLPVFRRMVGGGPVYIDRGQLFFQVVIPEAMTPARRGDAVRWLLEPAVTAFRDVGIAAELDDRNEVVLGDRKICGHAGGQIEQAVVVVGNVINSFDHEMAASVVRAPSPRAREEFLRQMKRFVTPTPTDFGAFIEAAGQRYAEALGLKPFPDDLSATERRHLAELDELFVDPGWIRGVDRRSNGWWLAKVKSGVWVGHGSSNGHRVTVAFEGDRICALNVDLEDGSRADLEISSPRSIEEMVETLGEVDPGVADLILEMAARPPA